jgi:chloramphenicol 3-O phosphotransferase
VAEQPDSSPAISPRIPTAIGTDVRDIGGQYDDNVSKLVRSPDRMAITPRRRTRTGGLGQCYLALVGIQVIVLNGVSSAGKSSIARSLQAALTTTWLVLGVDDLIRAMPNEGLEDGSLLRIGDTGQVDVGPGWRHLESSWHLGIAAMASSGTGVILDEVFLGGSKSQVRLRGALVGLDVLWVGVKCNPDVARAREALRPDRVAGMADAQAAVVHEGVAYDITVDTSRASPDSCAAEIISHMTTMG